MTSAVGATTVPGAGRVRRAVSQPAERPRLRLSLLRAFQLHGPDGGVLTMPLSAQRVIAFLALHDRPLARIFVAGHLWTDASEDRAGAALRTALWRITGPAHAVVRADAHTLALDPGVEIDFATASRCARGLLADDGAPAAGDLGTLCAAGELLPDWYDDWVLIERERFRQLRLHALEVMCGRLSDHGRHAEAAEAGFAAVVAEPLRESAHRALVRAHLVEGNPGEALRQYGLCRELLARELGTAPSPALEALVAGLPRR